MKACILAIFVALPAHADCPPVPDRTAELAQLFTLANRARSAEQARPVAAAMWAIWADAPDARSQDMLDRGQRQIAAQDLGAARETFDALIDYCPNYAEGYNQRAYAAYLGAEFEAALGDLDRAIARNPLHVAALSGRALTLIALGRETDAQISLRAALKLNPWLSERSLLRPLAGDL